MGVLRLTKIVRASGAQAYALGGVTNETARRLVGAGLIGIASVEGLSALRT
jgi:thiamine-phosphate pyrophosphorylase